VTAVRAWSWLETVDIAQVKASRADWIARHFDAEEAGQLDGMRDQTLAGFVAVKRALCGVGREALGLHAAASQFHLDREESGAPRLRACVGLDGESAERFARGVHISLSHSRTTAYGLAVWQESARG
jgi:phosphopantetheinyl transferase (holo-ACP synthase)